MERCILSRLGLVAVLLVAASAGGRYVLAQDHTVRADVVALDQAFYNNRLGTFQAGGMIFALRSDVVSNDGSNKLTPGNVMLRPDKRPRPLVLRMDVGDCMQVKFENLLAKVPSIAKTPSIPYQPRNAKTIPDTSNSGTSQPASRLAGIHVTGMELKEIKSDGSWVGVNDNSLSAPGDPPRTYEFCAAAEGAYLLYSTGADLGLRLGFGGQLAQGLFGAVTVQPRTAEWYRSQVTREELELATYHANALPSNMTLSPKLNAQQQQETFSSTAKTYKLWLLTTQTGQGLIHAEVTQTDRAGDPVDQNGLLKTRDFQPIINYQTVYPPGSRYPSGTPITDGTPVLAMLNKNGEIVHSDLTAIITGPHAGLFPDSESGSFSRNPTYPERRQPFREFTIHYHDDFVATQAFPEFTNPDLPINFTLSAARDFFAINYGMAAIGAEVWANRIKVGPMYQCDTCKFEEFFLSAWAVGDPAMIVDVPANTNYPNVTGPQATKALYPDDPSNVYHSYLGDHVQFRILHAGANITHVHHQHAHQWLHSPDSDESDYRDSQMISPGGTYTLDMTYFGSGNLNQTVGDSIFHCHFYPHFAQGMWSLWRVHDVFEEGTLLDQEQRPVLGWNRSLPDGEIKNGTPIPAIVPLPEIPMATMPARAQLCPVYAPKDYIQFTGDQCPAAPSSSATPVGYKALISQADLNDHKDPGFPFFVPGIGGQRVTHPPLDFAPEEDKNGKQVINDQGQKVYLDGGLPRLQALKDTGQIYEHHNRWDFSKDNDSLVATELDESGTSVEKSAMAFHAVRKHPSFTPEGLPGDFILNGQGPKPGAPYADPAVDIEGHGIPDSDCAKGEPGCIRYKAADIQTDVVLNKKGWHYPQQRMLTLWGDVKQTLDGDRRPEPLFFRANSKQVIEYWYTNLVPNYYELDDFQVRTPTDIIGQHIHLVKFDVTASDGAGNGFNYEDGTFSQQEVLDQIKQINKANGLFTTDASQQVILHAKEIPYFKDKMPGQFVGAQATIQRWYADPVYDCKQPFAPGKSPLPCEVGNDRTLRTVFTHDHFGPSTHQQIGLYAGLVIEPTGSMWFDSTTGNQLGGRAEGDHDGGPTTYQANIVVRNPSQSYREFMLEFQDRQLAYSNDSISVPVPYVHYTEPKTDPPGYWGWVDAAHAINPPFNPGVVGPGGLPTPHLITNQFSEGAYSLNYENEPLDYRIGGSGDQLSLAHIFQSIPRADTSLNSQPAKGAPINLANPTGFKFPPPQPGADALDPYTPLLRAYEGENIQVRNLVGAHMAPHAYHMHGLNWQFEPSLTNSGFRSTQGMGLSEHYELLFHLPNTTQPEQADYLYIPTSDTVGLQLGNWGLLRGYKQKQADLIKLSESQKKAFPDSPALPAQAATPVCPADAPTRKFDVTAVFARDVLGGPLVYNARGLPGTPGQQQIADWNAMMYVRTEDLVNGKLKSTAPREPLILRAAAGDCITVNLTNALRTVPMNIGLTGAAPFDQDSSFAKATTLETADEVGLHPQLVAYDVAESDGVNIGKNPSRTVKPGDKRTYKWFAGRITHGSDGAPIYTPVEFGAIDLSPADPLMQHNFGLVGGLIIEPKGSTWLTDDNSYASATVKIGPNEAFREAVAIIQDDLASLRSANPPTKPLGPTFTLDGAISNGIPVWELNGVPLANGSVTPIQPGQTITFGVASGEHGITFLDKAQAESVFGPLGAPFGPQTAIGPNAWGTPGETSGTLATLTVQKNIPSSITSLAFECTIHHANMAGTLALPGSDIPPPTEPADTEQAINYRTEPVAYRYLSPNYLDNSATNSPVGIARVVSDSLVAADPQTPVFVAEAGKPLRMRMLHPAGLNEQVFVLHGHNWQEEPYTHDSTRIGSNPLSQATGSRDAFGPNASFDVVLDHAGGTEAAQGDYLFRTYIGSDFLGGMWGIVRVGPPGKDVVTVTQFCSVAPTNKLTIQGVNTVNPSTHHMAKTVNILDAAGAIVTTAKVDPITGEWEIQSSASGPPAAITVVSPQGGTATVSKEICPIAQNQPRAAGPLVAPPVINQDDVFRFRPKPEVMRQSGDPAPAPTHPDTAQPH